MEFIGVEFFKTPTGDILYKRDGEPVKTMGEEDRVLVQHLMGVVRERYPKAFEALANIYTSSELNRALFEFQIVSRFIRCNFGEYDNNSLDIDYNGQFITEEVRCPLRGECRYESVICKPELNQSLTPRELEVVKLISEGYTSEEIADRLYISPLTVNRHRENIKSKLNVRTMAQLVNYYMTNLKDKRS